MNFQLFNFVTNNIILRDINSYNLLKIILLYNSNNLNQYLLHLNLNNIDFEVKDLNKIFNIFKNNNIKLELDNIYYLTDYHNSYFYNSLNNINYYLFNFKNLISIDFHLNRDLKDNDISKLVNLEILKLPKNKFITNKGLLNLNKLETIDLSANTNINNEALINKLNLKELTLIHNKNIDDNAFINITKLELLNLGYNNNRRLKLDFIKNNKKLQKVILFRKKNISNEIVDFLKQMEHVICYQLDIFN